MGIDICKSRALLMRDPKRIALLGCVAVLLTALMVRPAGPSARSYYPGTHRDPRTHPALACRSIELAIADNGQDVQICSADSVRIPQEARYAELGLEAYRKATEGAAIDEDTPPRYVNHFYDPSPAAGLPEASYTWAFAVAMEFKPTFEELQAWAKGGYKWPPPIKGMAGQVLPHYQNALDWGRDGMGDGLDWKGAIESYDYTPESKLRAYAAVGHVLHLIQDMAQPDHARNRGHPCNEIGKLAGITDRVGYEELWSQKSLGGLASWPKGVHVQKFPTLEQFFTNLAHESQQQENKLGLPRAGKELALGCGPLVWGPGIVGVSDANLVRIILQHGFDALYDAHWQEAELNLPAIPTIPISPSDPDNKAYKNLGEIMLPKAEEYGAGLLQFFHDIVNQPPFVEEVEILQNGERKYHKFWRDDRAGDPPHVKGRQAESEGGELEPGTEAKIIIRIGPRYPDPNGNLTVDRQPIVWRKQLNSLTVRVVPDGGKPEDAIPLSFKPQPEPTSPQGVGVWTGTITPTRSGTLRIEATDLGGHFKDVGGQREQSLTPVGGKRGSQGDLDSDPSTPARATWRESKAGDKAPAGAPYPWKGYEAGPDTNHHFTVKGGACPILAQMQWGKWSITYTRTNRWHVDTEACLLNVFACESPAAHDPASHNKYYQPCSSSYAEHWESRGYVFSAWPYPGSGDVICFDNCGRMVKVHFPWSQVQPDDFRKIIFFTPLMNDATISTKHDSTCGVPELHDAKVYSQNMVAEMGQRTQCDIQSINYHQHSGPAKDASGTESEFDEEFKYSFEAVEPPAHFRVVRPISFNLDDLSGAADAFVRTIVATQSAACGNAPKERVKSCYEAYIPLMQLRSVLERDAENQWGELARSFKEADELWWRRAPAADYEGKLAQLKVAASSWQGLSSTIPHHLSISVDNLAQTIGQSNPHAADELRGISQKLRLKGFDFPGPH